MNGGQQAVANIPPLESICNLVKGNLLDELKYMVRAEADMYLKPIINPATNLSSQSEEEVFSSENTVADTSEVKEGHTKSESIHNS